MTLHKVTPAQLAFYQAHAMTSHENKQQDLLPNREGGLPSKSRTAELGRKQLLPLTSEKNKPDDTPLWRFMGSPFLSSFVSANLWGGAAGLATGLAVFWTSMSTKAKTMVTLGVGLGAGALAAVLKAQKIKKQNKVYAAWMDTLGNERATLGMLKAAERQKSFTNGTNSGYSSRTQ